MSDLLGYARVSTADQRPDRLFVDTASGALDDRLELAKALDHLRPGDTLVVWKLDHLGRSLRHLIDTLGALQQREIGFRSLQESLDTTTPGGKLVFHLFGALAEFERDLIRQRTQAGRAAARARGRTGGRPPSMTPTKRTLGVSRASIYRHLAAAREADPGTSASWVTPASPAGQRNPAT